MTQDKELYKSYQDTAIWSPKALINKTLFRWRNTEYYIEFEHRFGVCDATHIYNNIYSGYNMADAMNACYKHAARWRVVTENKEATEHIFFEHKESKYKISIKYKDHVNSLYRVSMITAPSAKYVPVFETYFGRVSDVLDPWAIINHIKKILDNESWRESSLL